MMMILIIILLSLLVGVMFVQVFLSGKNSLKSESLGPLESGFEGMSLSLSLSTPFFFLAILFVLFDLELILFFPGVVSSFSSMNSFLIWIYINIAILITLALEWSFCGLKWQL